MKLQRLSMKMAALLLVITMTGVICSESRLLVSVQIGSQDEVGKAFLNEKETKVVEAKELSVDTDEPTDVSNHHSLPRQSFGDGGNDQNQLGSKNEERSNGTNVEKKN
ncbi:hypothetical protein MA16_Dca016405 [Dendrobium catenatum]|uniref:Uncharacterized protein n=1 Tax=Dendrobium catenatum TaxID=906689 RepID=A0A2I0VVB5_9ASPA|nr:hypothetical protein MA16_Dca016405 [Dendrobium catenatum]